MKVACEKGKHIFPFLSGVLRHGDHCYCGRVIWDSRTVWQSEAPTESSQVSVREEDTV